MLGDEFYNTLSPRIQDKFSEMKKVKTLSDSSFNASSLNA